MFEWLAEQYLTLIANHKILVGNPVHCSTVELLRLFGLTLFGLFLLRLGFHLVIFFRLRRRFPNYSQETHPELLRVYQRAAEKVKLRRLPPLFRFDNARPLIFTVGSFRPAIFLAEILANTLPGEELEAALAHELVHVKRRDNLFVWFLEIFFVSIPIMMIQVFAIHFVFSIPNSLYALLGTLAALVTFKAFLWRRILFLRELSCDDLAVEATRDPLALAASLMRVWRISKRLPKHRWQSGLPVAQTFFSAEPALQIRARRLLDYRRPRLKFLIGKAIRVLAVVFAIFMVMFLWRFYSTYDGLHLAFGHGQGFHLCSSRCGP